MKILMFYAHEWWHRTAEKSLPEAADAREERAVAPAAVIFLHVEAEDEGRREGVRRKFVKNVKWIAGKFSTRNIVLHSFNHLSASKSSPQFAEEFLTEAAARLESAGFSVFATPFGYFNEFRMHVAGDSLAKVFKEI